VAAGYPLSFLQCNININGWAIECRINAENPAKNFMPSPGKLETYLPPGGYGVRVDSAVYAGYEISTFYDSMVAKVIVWGKDRQEAIQRMKRALNEFVIEGIRTTIPFHLKLLEHSSFEEGHFNTKFLETHNLSIEKR
jgi:acetyl-CoA carboxylase, biotin carboxylase subunit